MTVARAAPNLGPEARRRESGDESERAPGDCGAHRRVQLPGDVEERQPRVEDVVGCHLDRFREIGGAAAELVVRDHRRLGAAGRARREHDGGRIARGGVEAAPGRRLQGLVTADPVGCRRAVHDDQGMHRRVGQVGKRVERGGLGHQYPGARSAHMVREDRSPVLAVECYVDGAGGVGAKQRPERVGPVVQVPGHAGVASTRPGAQAPQEPRPAPNRLPRLGVAPGRILPGRRVPPNRRVLPPQKDPAGALFRPRTEHLRRTRVLRADEPLEPSGSRDRSGYGVVPSLAGLRGASLGGRPST